MASSRVGVANPLAGFERIYIINLPSRADRCRQMAAQLARVGLSFDSPQVRLFAAIRPDEAGEFDSIGSRGCFLSHLGVLRESVGLRNVLIFEDDLDLDPGLRVPLLPADWSIFYGDARHRIAPTGTLTAAKPEDAIVCAHFVAFNGPVIAPLVDCLGAMLGRRGGDPAGGPMHVDGAYNHFRRDHPDARTLIATPGLGRQRPSRSDIHPLRWFDRLPGVREAVNGLRRFKRGGLR